MDELIIEKYKAKTIANALRLTANIYGCRNKKYETEKDSNGRTIGAETAWDRGIVLAEKYINETLDKGNSTPVIKGWIEFHGNEKLFNEMAEKNCPCRFEDGTQCLFDEEHPFAMLTHFKLV